MFLDKNEKLHVIISSKLQEEQEKKLVEMLGQHKKAISWTIVDLKGISPTICIHKILLEEDPKPTIDE